MLRAKKIDAFELWCWRRLLRVPWTARSFKPVNAKGNQPWIFIGRIDAKAETPILWLPDAKSWLTGKDPDAGKDWGQEEKGVTEDEIVGWFCCRNRYSRNQAPHSESWKTQVYYAGGPGGVNTLSSEPRTKGLQSFYRQTIVGNTSC